MSFKRLLFLLFILVSAYSYAGNGVVIKTVVIDAGHGGKDPGCMGPGKTNEKDVALAVALKLGEYIHKYFPDVNVIYTRKTDVFVELHERADLANKSKADLFIAIHCNSNNTPSVYGTSTYVLGLHRTEANLEVAKRENSVILLEDDRDKNYEFDPNTPEGHIIMSMKQNAFLDQSIDIASKIEAQFESTAKRKSLGVKQAGFYVIYKTAMPSLLSEIGFLSNPTEEKFLASDKGQDLIATSLYNAFKDYKYEMEHSEGEQFAYQEAKRKAATDTGRVAPVTSASQPDSKEVKTSDNKTSVTPAPASNEAEPDNLTATLLSGRKIRKPIDNSSGGGVAPASEKPVEAPPVKQVDETPAVEARKVTPGNSGGATIDTVKPVTKPKPTHTKPVESDAGTENASSLPVKTVKKPTETTSVKHTSETTTVKHTTVATHLTDGATFKVQLIALKGALKPEEATKITKALGEITNETTPNGMIRYYAGNSKTYSEALEKVNKAVSLGYKGAFIAGFKNGTRMTTEQLKHYENQ